MDLGLAGRVAIITGGARGIGLEHARVLGAEGARIFINDLDAHAGEEALGTLRAAGVDAIFQAGDATQEAIVRASVAQALEQFGRVDILINNAGIGVKPALPVQDLPFEAWRHMLRAHLDSTFLWSKEVLPPMKRGRFGRIVNTSSMNFTGGGRPGVSHYSAAKAGIVGLTQTLAKEAGPLGITVNAIAPGYVETELISQFSDDMLSRLRTQNPIGRLCAPREVASLAAYLCSVQAGFINGECLCIDGGRRDYYWG